MWHPQRSTMWPVAGPHVQPNGPHQPQQGQPLNHRVPMQPPYSGGHYQQPPLLPDPSWPQEAMILSDHFSQMSFQRPPPSIFQPQQPLRPHHQPAKTQQPQIHQTQIRPNANPVSSANNSGIPSLLDIRVPRPMHLNNGYNRPPPQGPPRPRMHLPPPIINTAVPPPRITVLQKPRAAPRPGMQNIATHNNFCQ